MQRIAPLYDRISDRITTHVASCVPEGVALLLARIALAGIFWRAGRSKVTEGSLFEISDATLYLFEYEYAGVPLPPEIAAPLATAAEHLLPVMLVVGLATRLSAAGLLAMTLVIQIFVYPEAWWTTHILWAALAAVLIARGGGLFSLDAVIARWRRA
ncbi:DoxX family protein [Leptolyngbya sp. 15MV]|nr:DoxX family protein [Leptolyngbya sp. 15MV]